MLMIILRLLLNYKTIIFLLFREITNRNPSWKKSRSRNLTKKPRNRILTSTDNNFVFQTQVRIYLNPATSMRFNAATHSILILKPWKKILWQKSLNFDFSSINDTVKNDKSQNIKNNDYFGQKIGHFESEDFENDSPEKWFPSENGLLRKCDKFTNPKCSFFGSDWFRSDSFFEMIF